MRFRLGLVLFACLTFASIASAQVCGNCVGGVCQPSADSRCDRTCCNKPFGTLCQSTAVRLICAGRSPAPNYFTSTMPQHTAGSSLRLIYAPAMKAPPVKCAASA